MITKSCWNGAASGRFSGVDGGFKRICRGEPARSPVNGFREEGCPGGHIGPPLRGGGGVPEPTGIGGKRRLSLRGTAGCGHPALRVQHRWCQATGRCGHRPLRPAGDGTPGSSCPTGGCGEPPRLPWPAAHSGAFVPAGARKWVGIAAEIIPKVSSNLGQSLSHGEAVTAPFTQGSLGDGGYGLPRRFAPRNDSPDPLSFRGGPTGRRGNPSFLRWTGVRAAEVVGPYGRSTEVPATGRCGHRPLRVVAESCRDLPGQRSERGKSSWSNSGFAR